jgi:predicted enzyme related to lactoylglutathione lyase
VRPMEMTTYAHGVPSWADLGTTDQPKTAAFYEGLFGWKVLDAPEGSGGYQMATLKDKMVAGLGPSQGGPMYWTTYINVDSADDIAARVAKAGGKAIVEPFDVMTAGRMGLFVDPPGAAFGVWQAGDHKGAGLVNEAGTMAWNELSTRDTKAAKDFYTDVFGWGATVDDEGDFAGYTQWQVDGRTVGGMMQTPDMVPPEVPAHWLVYFTVDDTDATAAKAKELGAQVVVPPMDIPSLGRFATLLGPHGEMFAVITFVEQPA